MSKVKLKMGMHNRITKERFDAMKADLKQGLTISKIAKQRGVSESTVRKVRRSTNYHEYRIRADEQLRSRRQPIVVIAEKSGLPYEDFGKRPIFSSKMLTPSEERVLSDRLDREAEKTARLVGIVLAWIVGAVVIVAIIAIACLLGGHK